MSISRITDPAIMGTGFLGRFNEAMLVFWIIMLALAIYYFAICVPVMAVVDRMLLRRRRRMFGDERVWVKELLAEAGRPPLARTSLPGRHRRPKQKLSRQEILQMWTSFPLHPQTYAEQVARRAARRGPRKEARRHAYT